MRAMSGTDDEINQEDEVYRALSEGIARITPRTKLTIAEFRAGARAEAWHVRRDENGTPTADRWPIETAVLRDPDAFYRQVRPAFIVRTGGNSPEDPSAQLLRSRQLPGYECQTPLDQILREAIRVSPLVAAYELALLDLASDRHHGDGRLELAGLPLFPIGASHGDKTQFQVRVEPTAGDGTSFVIVTRDRQPNVAPKNQAFQPVQIQSAAVPPGTYDLTAELTRPGRVVIHGLPVELGRPCGPGQLLSSWEGARRQVPERLPRAEPVHLICLVEACGGSDRLHTRIDRLVKLVNAAAALSPQLVVTVVSYGPHSVTWAAPDEAPAVRAWAAPADRAEHVLHELGDQRPNDREYLRAAQLECVLAWLASYLSDREGRLVLVAAGGRPPHPHRMDPSTQIIPCPDRVNWKPQFERLLGLGTTFGALRDKEWRGEIWQALGRNVAATVDDAVNIPDFVAALGLHGSGQVVPLPLLVA
jgi:hypothetical protein